MFSHSDTPCIFFAFVSSFCVVSDAFDTMLRIRVAALPSLACNGASREPWLALIPRTRRESFAAPNAADTELVRLMLGVSVLGLSRSAVLGRDARRG